MNWFWIICIIACALGIILVLLGYALFRNDWISAIGTLIISAALIVMGTAGQEYKKRGEIQASEYSVDTVYTDTPDTVKAIYVIKYQK